MRRRAARLIFTSILLAAAAMPLVGSSHAGAVIDDGFVVSARGGEGGSARGGDGDPAGDGGISVGGNGGIAFPVPGFGPGSPETGATTLEPASVSAEASQNCDALQRELDRLADASDTEPVTLDCP